MHFPLLWRHIDWWHHWREDEFVTIWHTYVLLFQWKDPCRNVKPVWNLSSSWKWAEYTSAGEKNTDQAWSNQNSSHRPLRRTLIPPMHSPFVGTRIQRLICMNSTAKFSIWLFANWGLAEYQRSRLDTKSASHYFKLSCMQRGPNNL